MNSEIDRLLEAGKQWRKDPPTKPGVYWWRRSYQWEAISRSIPLSRFVWSDRYENNVPVEKLGGEWLY